MRFRSEIQRSGGLRNIGSELGTQFCQVVSKERGFVAGAGDGDVAKTGIEHIWADAGIGVN
jgi:hypothetical protein